MEELDGFFTIDSSISTLLPVLPCHEPNINPSLMAPTVFCHAGEKPSHYCPLCLAVDHTKEVHWLFWNWASHLLQARQSHRPTPYTTPQDNFCCRFNRGYCGSSSCKFEHTCSRCFKQGHQITLCPDPKNRPKGLAWVLSHQGLPALNSQLGHISVTH